MSSTASQTRVTIDLADPALEPPCKDSDNKTKNTKAHPPRLQHSPSLPNIWFPPHSGPIPPQFEDISRDSLRRLSTPPPLENLAPLPPVKASAEKPATHRESLSLDQAEHMQQTQPLKIHMYRRPEYNQKNNHSLLTPPLTPSSSLKTVASSDSVADVKTNSESMRACHEGEPDHKSTRFIQLDNISRQIQHDVLRASIVETLTTRCSNSPETSEALGVPSDVYNHTLSEDCIKGVYLRSQQTCGTAILAFFDVRHAEIAKKIISAPTAGPLSLCVGDDLTEDGTRAWITCRFISAEELTRTIGSSPFLTSTNASFFLSVESKGASSLENEREHKVVVEVDDEGLDKCMAVQEDTTAVVKLNLGMLKTFLKSFGGLRVFSMAKDMSEKAQMHDTVFLVEYYDVRDATAAYTGVNNQILFGLRLHAFGREDLMEPTKPHCHKDTGSPYLPGSENSNAPFLTTQTEYTAEVPVQFGYPGQLSQIRERFFVEDMPLHSAQAQGQEAPAASTVPRSPVSSPAYFYTSDLTADPSTIPSPVDKSSYTDPKDLLYNTPNPNYGQWLWDSVAHSSSNPRPYTSTPVASYYVPCSTPSPYCSQHDQQPPLSGSFSPVILPVQPYMYPYDNAYPQPLTPIMPTNTVNLAFEHATTHMSSPQGGNRWFPETGTVIGMQNALYCSPPPSMPGSIPYPVSNKYGPQPSPDPGFEIYHPNLFGTSGQLSHSRTARSPLVQGQSSTNGKEPRPSAEHNQLNLGRIEDGQDTRTTVMIKNIPNKMSDKDLVAFIGKVCPRRIDFLYLRMDFQNGCNVGYAFVNFITVQDLLCFAKKKLGEKWNMFSSEKVLQMSYANYQGKEALVEKFKNSCIMDEQEAWRPKIFYSDPGPEQGLPEPFPAPTHMRRKERSAHNRGALFVPGVGRGSPAPQLAIHSRRLDDMRKASDRQGRRSNKL